MIISIVIPVYKSKSTISILISKLKNTLSTITNEYEIILVDDFCPQDSWSTILLECNSDSRIKGIRLTKNFGQHYAISAGVNCVNGNWIVIMDCDLQDNPDLIPELLNRAINNSSKIVFAKRIQRNDHLSKRLTSNIFHKSLSFLTNIQFDSAVANFGVFQLH